MYMNEILEVKNVTKYYGKGSVVTKALDGISLTVNKGGFTAIMGASGSGKSTLLNVIATIDRVSAGDICVEGKNISEMKENQLSAFRRDKLGFIFQEYNLLDTLTIGENITLPLNLKRVNVSDTQKELSRVSEVLGVADQLKKFPYELSGGQRQRAACARAIITNPALVLADEPTGALDSANSRNLMKTFELMNSSLGSTILMVTHDAVVGSYANRVLFLKDGQIWSEVVRGDRNRQEMYHEILSVLAALGGESDVR
jgi:putative ABC transport system ATP-binding protein